MTTAQSIPCRGGNVTASVSSGEAVLMLPTKGQIKVLNEVGTRVWELIDGTRDIETVVETLCREYAVEHDRALADTLAFVSDLVAKSLATLQVDDSMLKDAAQPKPVISGGEA
jgi:hypothetical protein